MKVVFPRGININARWKCLIIHFGTENIDATLYKKAGIVVIQILDWLETRLWWLASGSADMVFHKVEEAITDQTHAWITHDCASI